MIKNEVTKAILERRSIRAYKPQQITKEELDTVIECGFLAPSGSNNQKWYLSVVQNEDLIKRISKKNAVFMLNNPDIPEDRKARFEDPNFSFTFGAPTVIFIACPENENGIDASFLAENMVLTAQSIGLGTCYLGGIMAYLNTDEGKEFVKEFNFPKGYRVLYGLTLGYPDEVPDPKPRDFGKVVYVK